MPTTFRLNNAGLRQLLRSQEVRADLERRGQAMAAQVVLDTAGGRVLPVRVESSIGRNRARARVIVDDPAALPNEAKDRPLGRALDAARR